MMCEKCGKKKATVYVKQVINNKEVVQNLCEDCANELMDLGIFSLDKFFAGSGFGNLFGTLNEGRQDIRSEVCPVCGMSYHEYRESGRLGCSECYQTFARNLLPMIRNIHGKNRHVGKLKAGSAVIEQPVSEQASAPAVKAAAVDAAPPPQLSPADEAKYYEKLALQKQLEELVAAENFEEAVTVRDRIKSLEQELAGEATTEASPRKSTKAAKPKAAKPDIDPEVQDVVKRVTKKKVVKPPVVKPTTDKDESPTAKKPKQDKPSKQDKAADRGEPEQQDER